MGNELSPTPAQATEQEALRNQGWAPSPRRGQTAARFEHSLVLRKGTLPGPPRKYN